MNMDVYRIKPTTYRLPNLRYLRPIRLWSIIVCALLYFGVAIVAIYSDDEWIISAVWLIMIGGFVIAYYLIGVFTALGTKYRHQTQTTIAEYKLDITPVDAVVLLRCRTRHQFGTYLIQSLINKGALRVVRRVNVVTVFRDDAQSTELYPYEHYMLSLLVADGSSVEMSPHRLTTGRHVRQTERYILSLLQQRGFFQKRSWIQEFFIEYLRLIGPYCLAIAAFAVLYAGAPQLAEQYADNPHTMIEVRVLIGLMAGSALLVPLIVYTTRVYSRRGDDKVAQVVGYYWYLRTVYVPRIRHSGAIAARELAQHGPYIEALFDVRLPIIRDNKEDA